MPSAISTPCRPCIFAAALIIGASESTHSEPAATAYVAHVEIPASAPERVAGFYENLFGWNFLAVPDENGENNYWLSTTARSPCAPTVGVAARSSNAALSVPVFTVYVENLETTLSRLEASGGTITIPTFAVPGAGWLVYVSDPDGNPFALFQADPRAGLD